MAKPNREILTGGKRYQQRKSKVHRVEEVTFDKESRKNYLTGFHKRKLERRKNAKVSAEEQAKRERLEERAQIREERKLQVQRRLAELRETMKLDPNVSDSESESSDEEENDSKEDESWNGTKEEENKSGENKSILKMKQVFEIDNEDAPVSGTSEVVIESLENPNALNLDVIAKMNVDLGKSEEVLDKSIKRAKEYARLMGLSDKPERISKPKKKKFRYLSKTERKIKNLKEKNSAYKKRKKE